MTVRRRLVLTPIGHDPEIGRWLAALEDGRADTLQELEGVTPEMVDWYPDAPLLQHEAEHRSHIAWLRDTHPALTPSR